jgi:hypothetical protein
MTDDTYTFEMPVRHLYDDADLSTIGAYHRALGQVAAEATTRGVEGYSMQGMTKGRTRFIRFTVPAQVADDGRWLWRRSVL